MKNVLRKLFDNRFWYIGTTYAAFGDNKEFDNCPCIIICNPFCRWKPNKK